jgi:hypothetical protein
LYAAQCADIASANEIDRALLGLTDQRARNPESFPEVGRTGRFRLGKTDSWGVGLRLRLLFEILDEERVLLAAIKAETEEEADFIEGF